MQNYSPLVPIKGGNPYGEEPASYTRFVMPFAYQLSELKDGVGEPITSYRRIGGEGLRELEGERDRRLYHTKETSKSLFDHASWWRLYEGEAETATRQYDAKFYDGRTLRLSVPAPQIVLFEYREPNDGRLVKKDVLGTGFLFVDVYFDSNDPAPSLNNLLQLNELFRYRREPFESHASEKRIEEIIKTEALRFGDIKGAIKSVYDRWEHLLEIPIRVGKDEKGKHYNLLASDASQSSTNYDRPSWDIYADNRNYVWTCAVVKKSSYFGHWVKLLNADLPPMPEDGELDPRRLEVEAAGITSFERKWAEDHTYKRWERFGTLYGFTSHSGAVLAQPCDHLPLWRHFRQMYFDQVLLLLYLRVSLFRFSEALTRISAEARGEEKDDEEWQREFESLRRSFTLFTNLYQFPLISNQQQGVEMYALAREKMDITSLYEEVKEEVHRSHEYFHQLQQQKQTRVTVRLTWVATVGLVLSIILAYAGLSAGPEMAGATGGTSILEFLARLRFDLRGWDYFFDVLHLILNYLIRLLGLLVALFLILALIFFLFSPTLFKTVIKPMRALCSFINRRTRELFADQSKEGGSK